MKFSQLDEYADGNILAGVVDATGHIVINNPERHNAVSMAMYEAAAEQVSTMASDDDVRLLMIRGAGGKAFASGADISKFEKNQKKSEKFQKPITAENNVVKMAKSLVSRMTKGFTAPKAAKAPN